MRVSPSKILGITAILFSLYTNGLLSRELTEEEYHDVAGTMERAGGQAWYSYGTVHRNNDVYEGTAYVIDKPRKIEEICLAPAVFMTAKANSNEQLSWKPNPQIRYHIWFDGCLGAMEKNSTILHQLIASEALNRIKNSESLLYEEGLKMIKQSEGYEGISKPRLTRIGLRIDEGAGIVYEVGFEVNECLGLDVHLTFEKLQPVVLDASKVLC